MVRNWRRHRTLLSQRGLAPLCYVCRRNGHIPLSVDTTLPQRGRLVRVPALLLMNLHVGWASAITIGCEPSTFMTKEIRFFLNADEAPALPGAYAMAIELANTVAVCGIKILVYMRRPLTTISGVLADKSITFGTNNFDAYQCHAKRRSAEKASSTRRTSELDMAGDRDRVAAISHRSTNAMERRGL